MKTGSYNHNEIVIKSGEPAEFESAADDVEAPLSLRAGAIGGNHNQICVVHDIEVNATGE
ncbi:hypothetical protein ACFU3O_14750 [Streptomyces antibioticus]|uniref:hypothetical protein n=1 Tax=Streptomyces antibioticus TaxID=1890 RepID=UPI0036A18E86